jgi:Recombinase
VVAINMAHRTHEDLSRHDAEQVRGRTSSRRRSVHECVGVKSAADARALVMLPTIRMLIAAGFVSQRGLANELNRRGIPGAVGGRWHRTTVVRMLRRLDLLMSQRGINSELVSKSVVDVRAESLRPTIRKLRKSGFGSIKAIAAKLNDQGIAAPRGGKWHLTTVTRLLERLDSLDRASRTQHRP